MPKSHDASHKEPQHAPDPFDENVDMGEFMEALKDEAPSLEDELKEAQDALAAMEDKQLRLAAEYENFRKRSRKEQEALYRRSICDVVKSLLPVLDSLDRAIDAGAKASHCESQQMGEGLLLVRRLALEQLKTLGVEEIPCENLSFDPAWHEAVQHIQDDEAEANSIVTVVLKGYRLKDQVIRHSQVVVAN